MLTKKLFNIKQNELFASFLEKKTLAKYVYGKSWIRSTLRSSKDIQILDYNGFLFNIFNSELCDFKKQHKSQNTESPSIGASVNVNTFVYKNKKNNALKFRSALMTRVPLLDTSEAVFSSLQTVSNSTTFKSASFFVLKPIKGGFVTYSSGLLGFLPRSHALMLLSKFISSLIEDFSISRKLKNFYILGNTLSFNTKNFVLRLPVDSVKLTIYPKYTKNNFSISSKHKRRGILNDYNFVFLSNGIEKPHNKYKLLDAKTKKIFTK